MSLLERTGALAAVSIVVVACLAARAEGEPEKPARTFYVPVSIQSCGVPIVATRTVDFPELLAAAGESRPVDVASLRVWQVDKAGKPLKEVRWNYLVDQRRLIWAVDGSPAKETAQYRVHFRTAGQQGPAAPPALRDPALAPNLFCAGDFESSRKTWGDRDSAELDTAVAHGGRASLRMGGKPGSPYVALCRSAAAPIPAEPSRAYRVSMWLKSDGRLLRTIAPHYSDEAGKIIDRDMMSSLLRVKRLAGAPGDAPKKFDWTEVSFTVKTRPGAARMSLSFVLVADDQGGTGSLWVDDVRVEPLEPDELATIVDVASGRTYSSTVPPPVGTRCFDFGPAGSRVFQGFTQVTADTLYDRAHGFGFKDKSQTARDCIYPDPLSSDLVVCEGKKTSTFLVDLPDGRYGVWVLSGVNSGGYYEMRCPYQVRVSGGDAMGVEITAANYHKEYLFRAYYDFLAHDDGLPVDVYQRYFRALFREKVLTATVRGGQLAVEVVPGKSHVPSSAGFLNALVVYPSAAAKPAETYLAWLGRKRARQGAIQETATPDPSPEPNPTVAENQRGYILFSRPWPDVLYPNTRPTPGQTLGELRAVAIAGQWEPVGLCVYPLRELGNCRIGISDLVGPDGRKIPGSSVEISVTRFFACRVQANSKTYAIDGYRREAQLVMPGDTASVHAGVTRQFLLTVTPPEGLPRGIYRGRITVNPELGKPAELDLAVLVIPLRLIPPEGWHTSFRYTHPIPYDRYPFPEQAESMRRMLLAELRQMKHFRNTSAMMNIHNWAWVGGLARNPASNAFRRDGLNPAAMEVFLKWFKEELVPAYLEAGITEAPVYDVRLVPLRAEPDPESFRVGQEFLKAMYASCRDLPLRLIYDFGGEWSNFGEGGGRNGKLAYSWAKQALPGIVTGTTLNGKYCLETLGYVDYVSLRTYMFSDALVREIGEKKGVPYVYGYPDRFSNGLYLWRVRAKGNYLTEYYTHTAHGELFNDFDTPIADLAWIHALPSPDGPVPRVLLYSRAAGFLDALTLYTLEALVAKAEAAGSPKAKQLAAEAKAFLDELRSSLPDEYPKIEQLGLKPTPSAMDKTRLSAALKAYELQQALGERP